MLHPGFEPVVTSLSALAAALYSHGFKNPSGFFPAVVSWSFSSATTLANTGLAHDVPSTPVACPSTTTSNCTPCVDTSGYARPEVLNKPLFVLPRVSRYAATAVCWYAGVPK